MNVSEMSDDELFVLAGIQKPAPQEPPTIIENAGRAAAKGATALLGFPADAAIGLAQAGAAVAGEEPIIGDIDLRNLSATDVFKDIIQSAGFSTTPEPQSTPERFLDNTIEAVTSGQLGLGLARGTTGLAGRALKRNFRGYAVEDAVAATTGAAARTIAEEAGFGEGATTAAELFANMGAGAFVSRARAARDFYQASKQQVQGLTDAERDAAAQFFQSPVIASGDNPKAVANAIRSGGPEGSELLTPSARSRNVALQELANAVIKADPVANNAYIKSQQSLMDYIKDQIRVAIGDEAGESQDFVNWYVRSGEFATNLLESARQSAISTAAREIAELPPVDADFSTPLRSRLESLKLLDRNVEKELWDDVVNATVDPAPMKTALDDLMKEAKTVDIENSFESFPSSSIRSTIQRIASPDDLDAPATVEELLALKSNILESKATATANGQHNLARRLNTLLDGVMTSLTRAEGGDREALEQASRYSRDFNDRYSRDVIGPLMAQSGRRDKVVPDNETMEYLFKPGEVGRTNFRALRLAMGEVPKEAKNYVLQRFFNSAIENDQIAVGKAERFIQKNRPLLEEAGLMDLVSSYVLTGKRVNEATTALANSVDTTAAASVIKRGKTGDDLTSFIASQIKSEDRNVQKSLTELFDTASTNLTGEAIRGLRSATAEAVIRNFFTFEDIPTNQIGLRKTRVINALNATGQYTEAQIKRIEELVDIANTARQAEKQKAFKGQSVTAESLAKMSVAGKLMRYLALTQVAPRVNKAGPGSLATAQMLGNLGEKLGVKITSEDASSLIRAAVNDQDVMAALLEMETNLSPKGKSVLSRFLKAAGRTAGKTVGAAFQPSQISIINDPDS